MKILVLNGSPHKQGITATLLKSAVSKVSFRHEIEWVDLVDLSIKPCLGCMKCRDTSQCVLPADGGQEIGKKIAAADALIIGSPVYWGNMSSQLKMVFDRNVAVMMGESKNGLPIPRHKGKKAAVIIACSTPWPFNILANQSTGALKAILEVLHYSGYRMIGKVVKPGTKTNRTISNMVHQKAAQIGARL